MTQEETKKLISRAFNMAKAHGFHDEPHSIEHYLMLVLSEIGEAVEADRKGRNKSALEIFEDAMYYRPFTECFEGYIKDSVPDELADVCIRLYDMCGALNIEPDFNTCLHSFPPSTSSFCERCFRLCCILTMNEPIAYYLPSTVASALFYIEQMCEDMNINLQRHIELKMKYNEARPKRHGKKY